MSFVASLDNLLPPTANRAAVTQTGTQTRGYFLFNAWDRSRRTCSHQGRAALAEFQPGNPLFLARSPHGYHNPALIRSELEKQGF